MATKEEKIIQMIDDRIKKLCEYININMYNKRWARPIINELEELKGQIKKEFKV